MAVSGEKMQVAVPDGAAAGQLVSIKSPAGEELQVEVPAGLTAGAHFFSINRLDATG